MNRRRNKRALAYAGACGAVLLAFFNACTPQSSGDDSAAAAALLLAGVAGGVSAARPCPGRTANAPAGTAVADTVNSAPGDLASGFFDAVCAVDGVRGEGDVNGSLDVYTLGASGAAATLILEWSGRRVTNGGGADFIVFENAFFLNGDTNTRFMEPTIVEVSNNGADYCGWTPNYANADETVYSKNPAMWQRFAGISPVYYNQDTNNLNAADLFTPATAGGDAFDLGDANFGSGCAAGVRTDIQTNGFVYVKLTSATARTNPDTGASFVQDAGAFGGGPDIDGVIARNLAAR